MKQHINSCTFYFLVCLLCSLSSGFLLFLGQVVLVLISLYYAIYANIYYKLPVTFKALNVLIVIFSIYGFILIVRGEQLMVQATFNVASNYSYLLYVYRSLLPIYAFYVFARRGLLTENNMRFWFLVFLILTIRSYYLSQAQMLRLAYESGSSVEEFTNNVGYSFVALLPAIVLFYRKPTLQYILLIICGFFIVSGVKRGAILTGGICLIWFLFVNYKKTRKKRRWIIVLFSLIVLFVAVFFIQYKLETSSYFLYRFEATKAGESSQRNILYTVFYDHFVNESNPLRFLFGNGANATLKIGGNYAHNDWFEIAINQGLLGLVAYLVYWLCFIFDWRKTKGNPQAFMAVGMLVIVYFMRSLFSMSIIGISRCSAMVLGYYLAISFQQKEINLKDYKPNNE